MDKLCLCKIDHNLEIFSNILLHLCSYMDLRHHLYFTSCICLYMFFGLKKFRKFFYVLLQQRKVILKTVLFLNRNCLRILMQQPSCGRLQTLGERWKTRMNVSLNWKERWQLSLKSLTQTPPPMWMMAEMAMPMTIKVAWTVLWWSITILNFM